MRLHPIPLRTLLFLLVVLLAAPIAFGAPPIERVHNRILITVTDGAKMAPAKSGADLQTGLPGLDKTAGVHGVRAYEQLYAGLTSNFADKSSRTYFDRVWAVDFAEDVDLERVKADYLALPEVEEVTFVEIYRQLDAYLPNDISPSQYHLRNMTPGGKDIRAVGGWNQSLGDTNVIVAVIDSGVDWHHPDLGGSHPDKVNGAIWTNWTEYYGTAGVDDDGNGKVDDIRGWDFVSISPVYTYPGEDATTQDNDPMDFGGHGTMVAGCIAPITNNGIGVAAAAPGVKIMALRAGYLNNADPPTGLLRTDFISAAMLYAANNGAKIINASWSSSSVLSTVTASVKAQGLLIVAAAGNESENSTDNCYLGTVSGVLAVAAIDENDEIAYFSNYGAWVELAAPGMNIYTTTYDYNSGSSSYGLTQGTSFSAPIVAGAAALIWSQNPELSYWDLGLLLRSTADDVDYANPSYTGLLGDGRPNLLHAMGDNMHRMPSEFPTVFDAINSYVVGDTIGFEGGVVIDEALTFFGADLLVLGGYSADYTSRDPVNNKTIIDGGLNATVMTFSAPFDNSNLIEGFKLTGGGGQVFSGIPYSARYGGGLILNGVSPVLRHFEITGNSVGSSSQLGCGGGVMVNNSNVVLEDFHIHGNTGLYGAGFFANNSTVTLVDCVIEDNTVITDNLSYSPRGGGLHLVDSDVTLDGCTVTGHLEADLGGGLYAEQNTGSSLLVVQDSDLSNNSAKTGGGGLYATGGSVTLDRVSLNNNLKLPASTFMNGGGFQITGAVAVLDSLTVTGNDAQVGGGGTLTACTSAEITNSLFAGNTGFYFAGGLYYDGNPTGEIAGNTFAANEGTLNGGGGLYLVNSTPHIHNNLSAYNTGGSASGNGMSLGTAPASLYCNNVYGNDSPDYSGIPDPTGTDTNISENPNFCNLTEANYNIASSSPCDPANSDGCGLIGALNDPCGESPVPDGDPSLPSAFRVQQNFPNPFNPSTTLRFELSEPNHTTVAIFDVAGHRVRTLVNEHLPASSHRVTWAGRDDNGRHVAAGVYFYMVASGDNRSVGRMALVK